MFKSCRNLFNLSRKLGSVVGGLGLAGILFAGQVSATGSLRWKLLEVEFLANVVRGLVRAGNDINWYTVAGQFNNLILDPRRQRTPADCMLKCHKLAEQNEEFRNIYDPSAGSWTDEDIGHLADVVRELVNAGNDISWDTVADQFNRLTNEDRTSEACKLKCHKLAEQDEEFRSIYDPSRYNLDRSEAARRRGRRFTQDEDRALMRLVQLNKDQWGRIQWEAVAQSLNARKSARQCRDRYRNYLQSRNHVTIPRINTALAAPITANGNQNAVNTTNTSNAATQSGQVLPGPANINININLIR